MTTALLLLLCTATPADLEAKLRALSEPEGRFQRDGDRFTLAFELEVTPPNAASAADKVKATWSIEVALVPYVEPKVQAAQLAATTKTERRAWKSVEKLACEGMDFSDQYREGLCFHAKTRTQQRDVAAYEDARKKLLAVPRFTSGTDFSVIIRLRDLEPTTGSCGTACAPVLEKVKSLFTAYK